MELTEHEKRLVIRGISIGLGLMKQGMTAEFVGKYMDALGEGWAVFPAENEEEEFLALVMEANSAISVFAQGRQ
jgi:hypothetical protein